MKNVYLSALVVLFAAATAFGQFSFDPSINPNYTTTTVVMPASPLKMQVLFVGGTDMVQTTPTYGNPATAVPAKEWHDFIGFTPDNSGSGDLGWIIVNHEMIQANDNIGDGGGMTSFKVKRDPNTDTLMVVAQTLNDGRTGKFFNVDFVNTVGETGMNCGGIVGPTGRIWTAEEWWIDNNAYFGGAVRDTTNYTITSDIAAANGQTIKKAENFNWMVEVDPKQAVAIRKQYNWGRNSYEGGAILSDNRTVFLGADDTPGFMTKFVADVAGDFTKGKTYVYKHDAPSKWVEIDNTNFGNMLNFRSVAAAAGATMFVRLEWVTYDESTNAVYLTETGTDKPGAALNGGFSAGGVYAPHHVARATAQGTTPNSSTYADYYGRVLKLDLATNMVSVHLEAGPSFATSFVHDTLYPASGKHLSNPDGLSTAKINGKSFLLIQEDLNGTSYGRVPNNLTTNRTCELFMLDLSIANPSIDDLIRISIVPAGAEITGAICTPDGKTILVDAQHPSTSNPFPYNHSLTYAITGFDKIVKYESPEMLTAVPQSMTRVMFGWASVQGATSYKIRVREAGTTKYKNYSFTGNNGFANGLTAGATYQFSIQTSDANGNASAWSATQTFTMPSAADVCATSMASFAAVNNTSARVWWSYVAGATSYRLRYREVGANTWNTISTNQANRQLSGLTAGATYEYQVRTNCAAGLTPFSASYYFTMPASAKASNTATSLVAANNTSVENANSTFSIYPNPVTRELRLNETMDVAIYDAQGQLMMVVRNTNRVDVSNLAAGVYFVKNLAGATAKIIIQK